MEITLYVGDSKEHLKFFTDLFYDKDSQFMCDKCYLGYSLIINTDNHCIKEISCYICDFLVEFYLKESILSKVYDEYSVLDVEEASIVLSELSKKMTDTDIFNMITNILNKNHKINIESFVIFNLCHIMTIVYLNVDNIAEKIISDKQKYGLMRMIKRYSPLNFYRCRKADVEFSEDNTCNISLDDDIPITVSADCLFDLLIRSMPESINMFFEYNQPETSRLIRKIFVEQLNKNI